MILQLFILFLIVFSKLLFPSFINNYISCQNNALEKCRVQYINQQQCLNQTYNKCPQINGSYEQCTNNYWSYDRICPCDSTSSDLCPLRYRLDGICYNKELEKCPKITNKERGIYMEPCSNLRINMFHSSSPSKLL